MTVWILSVVFLQRSLFWDVPSLYVDPTPYASAEACQDRARELIAGYGRAGSGMRSGVWESYCQGVSVSE